MATKKHKNLDTGNLKDTLVKVLDLQKAEDIHSIDLKGTGFPADYMIVASGRSGRQVVGLAEKVLETLSALEIKDVKKEGFSTGDWVILDVGDIVLHIFKPEVRLFYNIEKIWDTTTTPMITSA